MTRTDTIKQYLVDEFLPDVSVAELTDDHDLLDGGVVDSLGLLKLIAWVEDRFDIAVDDASLDPDNFRTVAAIDALVTRATTVTAV